MGDTVATFAKKHIGLWRAMFLLVFLSLITAGLIDAGFASLPFVVLMAAGIIEALSEPARP